MSAIENLFPYYRVQLILCKDNANERNENLFPYCRVQLILCKDNASRGKDKIINKVFCIVRNLYKYSSQNCDFSNETSFVLKNAKIGHFALFLDKSLVIRGLSRFLLFLALLERVLGLVILQRRLR